MSLPAPPCFPSDAWVVSFVAAMIRLGHRQADLAAAFLREVGIQPAPGQTLALPREFLLEVGAIMQIAQWEQSGLRDLMPVDLPSAGAALDDLARRLYETSEEYAANQSGTELSMQVMKAWIRHCALAAPEELGVDVVLHGRPAVELLEEIADFLWQHRHLADDPVEEQSV